MTTPHHFDIIPHVGIGPVRLGMSLAEVDAALAPLPGALPVYKKSEHGRCFFRASLQIEFGNSGTVQFIGVSNDPDLLCVFEGRDVFDLSAPDLFALIASRERTQTHHYSPLEYLFPDQIVTLYEADEQYDRKGGGTRPVFAEVGVGNAEYLAAIRTIRGGPAAG
jgi:hypothetical protein